jgi:hypothetical protein
LTGAVPAGLPGDLVGLASAAAEARAQAAGWAVIAVWTRPPWPGDGFGQTRVVRLRAGGPGRLELTLAREGYARPGEDRDRA